MSKLAKIMRWLAVTVAVVAGLAVGYWYWHSLGKASEQEVHLLPGKFEGVVYIVFGYPNGRPPEYESGKRIYRIPENGILHTQFKAQSGVLQAPEYYYVSPDNSRKPVPYRLPQQRQATSGVYVSSVETGSGGCQPTATGEYSSLSFRSYIVTDSLHEVAYYAQLNDENTSPPELICDPNVHPPAAATSRR